MFERQCSSEVYRVLAGRADRMHIPVGINSAVLPEISYAVDYHQQYLAITSKICRRIRMGIAGGRGRGLPVRLVETCRCLRCECLAAEKCSDLDEGVCRQGELLMYRMLLTDPPWRIRPVEISGNSTATGMLLAAL